jgi:hypothetical protein
MDFLRSRLPSCLSTTSEAESTTNVVAVSIKKIAALQGWISWLSDCVVCGDCN